MKRMYK